MAPTSSSGHASWFERISLAMAVLAGAAVLILWATGYESSAVEDIEVGDCVANVPLSEPEESFSLPEDEGGLFSEPDKEETEEEYTFGQERESMPATDIRRVECSDSDAQLRVVSETDGTCPTDYAIAVGQTEYCLEELGPADSETP